MTTIKHLYIRIFLPLLGTLLSLSLAQAAAPFVVFAPEEGCFTLAENGEMALPVLHELTEGALPDEVEAEVVATIAAVDGVLNVHEMKTRKNSLAIILSAHIVVDSTISVSAAHHITVQAENAVREKFGWITG